MKKINYSIIALALAAGMMSCSKSSDERLSTPTIVSATLNPSSLTYGDSLELKAVVHDEVTPLSTLEVAFEVDGVIVQRQSIRTKGNNVTVDKKFLIPFAKGATEGAKVTAYLTAINIDGYEAKQSVVAVTMRRPVFEKLYLQMKNGTTLELTPRAGNADIYESVKDYYSNNIFGRIVSKKDLTGYIWAMVDSKMDLAADTDPFFNLNDPTMIPDRIIFNTKTFELQFEGVKLDPMTFNGSQFTVKKPGIMQLTMSLVQNQLVDIKGFSKLDAAIDPDFFVKDGDKYKFLGESGSYYFQYHIDNNFIYVEQSSSVYPNALWACGVGMGKPMSPLKKTTSWNWNEPTDYCFVRKVGATKYQLTVYLKHETGLSWSDEVSFKFFNQKGWGGEFDTRTLKTLPNGFVAKSDGNVGATTDLAEGVYKLTLDLDPAVMSLDAVKIR